MSLADIASINPSSVLDIGSNVSGWYREAKALWPSATYHLIEGNEACLPYLEATGEPFTMAYLGDKAREVTLFKRKGGGTDTGNSYYRELTDFFTDQQIVKERVKLVPLSDVLPVDAQFELIKADTQGSELDIIRGGLDIFKRAKHILLEVAYTEYNAGAPMVNEVFAFMDELGFPARQVIGEICHPIFRSIIQRDVLFSR